MKLDEKAAVVKVATELLKMGDAVTALGWGIPFQPRAGLPVKLVSVRLNVSKVDAREGLTYTVVGRNEIGIPVDTCAGDSGGPLLAWRDDAWRLYATLQGGGYNCVKDRISGDGVWNSLAKHSDWIQEFVGRKSELVLSSTAGAAEYQGASLGEYVEEGTSSGRSYYRQRDDTGKEDTFLYYNGACGDEKRWLVVSALGDCSAALRNPADTATPPESGWLFTDGEEWRSDDRSLGLEWGVLEPCRRVEVAARGEAVWTRQEEELGSFSPTGRWQEGRPVYGKTGGETRYLRMAEGKSGWLLSPTLRGGGGLLESARGTLSPGDPAAGPSVRFGREGWWYWDGGEWWEGGEWRDSRGQLTVTCG